METFIIGKFRFRQNLACFDYDGTIIKPKGKNNVVPKDIEDWIWLRDNVPEILKKLYNNKYAIIIFTNQSKKWKKDQIINVLSLLDIPIMVNIAFEKEYYKPNPKLFIENIKKKWKLDKSFYCGDALGRNGDWSNVDLLFGNNIGIKVIEPERIFPIETKEIDVANLAVLHNEMVIMIGFPGSGKSTFVKNNFSNYTILSGDELKTEAKIIKEINKNIGENSIVIDATNPGKDKRKKFIDIANSYNIPVRCIYMNVSKEQALLQNNKRDKPVPAIVFNIFNKRFEYPTEDEGCSVVVI